jgi:hypothetical protein
VERYTSVSKLTPAPTPEPQHGQRASLEEARGAACLQQQADHPHAAHGDLDDTPAKLLQQFGEMVGSLRPELLPMLTNEDNKPLVDVYNADASPKPDWMRLLDVSC